MQQLLRCQPTAGCVTPANHLKRANCNPILSLYSRATILQPCRSTTSNVSAAPSMSPHSKDIHPLWQRVLEVYDRAQQSGAATKTDTQIQLFEDGGITFVLRLASALKKKPKGLSGSSDTQQQQQQQAPPPAFRNPFLPYEEELWVQQLSDSHTLLLNKFNVVPHHVLVVTRQYESQQDALNSRDLAATQQVLAAMPQGGVAFYNCGEHSGRSQPHKHVQVVPLPFAEQQAGQQCSSPQAPIEPVLLAAQSAAAAAPLQPFEVRQLPYRAYAVVLTDSTTANELEAAANQLLAMCQAGLPAPVSYNVVLTSTFMMMVPRRQEMCGLAAINSLGFAGTILLKSDEDMQFAQQQRPLTMLAAVGQPWQTT